MEKRRLEGTSKKTEQWNQQTLKSEKKKKLRNRRENSKKREKRTVGCIESSTEDMWTPINVIGF